jgi:hypothetical protein
MRRQGGRLGTFMPLLEAADRLVRHFSSTAPTARRRYAPNPVFAGSTVPFGVLSVVTDRLKNLSLCTSSALAPFLSRITLLAKTNLL